MFTGSWNLPPASGAARHRSFDPPMPLGRLDEDWSSPLGVTAGYDSLCSVQTGGGMGFACDQPPCLVRSVTQMS